MFEAKYDSGLTDPIFRDFIGNMDRVIKEDDDDFILFCTGLRSSGKSNLMLHALEMYLGDKASKKNYAANLKDFADMLETVAVEDTDRKFCGNDEFNINKREALSQKNKDTIDLLFAIRGLNIFHWWNNPSADFIDKTMIEELFKGLILITTKDKNKPRTYYYFNRKALLTIYEKYGNIKNKTLSSVCGKYATWKGWFKSYEGFLKKEYLESKQVRMLDKVKEFKSKHGSKIEQQSEEPEDVLKDFNQSSKTAKKIWKCSTRDIYVSHLKKLQEEGVLVEGVDFIKKPFNNKSTYFFKSDSLIKARDRIFGIKNEQVS